MNWCICGHCGKTLRPTRRRDVKHVEACSKREALRLRWGDES